MTGRAAVDAAVNVGSIRLPHAVMTASGTAGHGAELGAYGDLSKLGAVVVKSLAAYEWRGNPSPRVHPTPQGMINAVGLQGPGVTAWLRDDLPHLEATGARVVVSIWGRTLADYRSAAEQVAAAGPSVIAVEINLSCPNLEGRSGIFAHDPDLSAAVVAACDVVGRPRWAKLSPNTDRVVEVARSVSEAGAEAITLINTLLGMVIDPATRKPALGNGGGGLSGRGIHPIAVRAVYDVHDALPELALIGVGGVTNGWDAAELMLAGACAVQVGTATFADPRAPWKVANDLVDWAAGEGISCLADLTGAVR